MINVINDSSFSTLHTVEDNFFDALGTDPPYGLSKEPDISAMLRAWLSEGYYEHGEKGGMLGMEWDAFVPQPLFWKEVFRTMKPGAFGFVFSATRNQDLMGLSLRMAGFRIVDCLAWVYSQGMPKTVNLKRFDEQYAQYGTALKPSMEPILLIQKPISERNVYENMKRWGTGALRIYDCAIGTDKIKVNVLEQCSPLGQVKNPSYETKTKKGRYPKNVVIDDSDDVAALFPDSAGAGRSLPNSKTSGFSANHGGTYDYTGGERIPFDCGEGSAARFFYQAKVTKAEREGFNTHPTVKPTSLVRYFVRLVTPVGGTVLDPFAGSGTTGVAASLENLNAMCIEKDTSSFDIMQRRLAGV